MRARERRGVTCRVVIRYEGSPEDADRRLLVRRQGFLPAPDLVRFKALTEGLRFDRATRQHVATLDKLPGIVRRLRDEGFSAVLTPEVAGALEAHEASVWLDLHAAQTRLATLAKSLAATGKSLYPYQRVGVEWLTVRHRALLADGMGVGKAQPVDEPVLTPAGWRPIGDLRVGDKVIGADGRETYVAGVYPQGRRPLYRVTMTDGAWTRCTGEHLWRVETAGDRYRKSLRERVMTTDELRSAPLQMPASGNNRARCATSTRWFVPLVKPVQMPARDLPVHPYLLGALLAKGVMRGTTMHVGTDEQREEIRKVLPPHVKLVPRSDAWASHFLSEEQGRNLLTRALCDLDVKGIASFTKNVPSAYLRGSLEQRLALLQGLCDSDGCVSENGRVVEYRVQGGERSSDPNTVSPQLCEDVAELVRSLGGVARISTRIPAYWISLPGEMCPFRVPSKRARFKPRTKYPPLHGIESIVADGEGETVCIRVESADRLYVTRHHILTHNSVQTLCALPPNAPVLVICPAVVKGVWIRETGLWRSTLSPQSLDGRGSFRFPKPGEMIITNFDILPQCHLPSCPKKTTVTCDGCSPILPEAHLAGCTRGTTYCPGCAPLPKPHEGTVLVVDEAHNVKNRSTRRGESVRALAHAIRARGGRSWYLTGTPILNNPEELWSILESCDLAHEAFGSWKDFVKCFAGKPKIIEIYDKRKRQKVHKQIGYEWGTPLEGTVERLQRVMLRRLKSDVLQDLPVKTRRLLPVDVSKASLREFDKMLKELGGAKGLAEILSRKKIPFEMVSTVRSALARAKIPAMLAQVEQYEEQKEPLLVFSAHRAPIDLFLERDGWAVITGDTPARERTAIEEGFQAGAYKGLAGTIEAAGVGITLTYAAHEIFVDQEWTPALNDQAEDRALRHGQKRAVFVDILVANHPLDQRVAEILLGKTAIITSSVDAAREIG